MSIQIKLEKPVTVFLISVISGPILWATLLFVLPLQQTKMVSLNTCLFVFACYSSMLLGFIFLYDSLKKIKTQIPLKKVFIIFISIVILSHIIRYFDLVHLRGMSFEISPKLNRIKAGEFDSLIDFITVIGSVFKSLYFFPLIIYLSSKSSLNRIFGAIAIALMLLPFYEGVLLGLRRLLIEPLVICLIFVLCYYKPKKQEGIAIIISTLLIVAASAKTFISREFVEAKPSYETILSAKYNHFVQPSERTKEFLQSESNNKLTKLFTFSMLHAGQYYIHGLYEFDSIYNQKSMPQTYGGYTFSSFFKALGKEPPNPSPRGNVYITAFGGFYFDFRWFAPMAFFLFGSIQGIFFSLSKSILWIRPLVVYFVMINFFLISINYIRGAGIYPLLSSACLLIILILFNRK
jgi:hypothetical protein